MSKEPIKSTGQKDKGEYYKMVLFTILPFIALALAMIIVYIILLGISG